MVAGVGVGGFEGVGVVFEGVVVLGEVEFELGAEGIGSLFVLLLVGTLFGGLFV